MCFREADSGSVSLGLSPLGLGLLYWHIQSRFSSCLSFLRILSVQRVLLAVSLGTLLSSPFVVVGGVERRVLLFFSSELDRSLSRIVAYLLLVRSGSLSAIVVHSGLKTAVRACSPAFHYNLILVRFTMDISSIHLVDI